MRLQGRPGPRLALYGAALLFVLYVALPLHWLLVSSFEQGTALFEPSLLPTAPSLENYRAVFLAQPFGRNIANSVLVAFGTVALALTLSVPAAFAFARVRFRGRSLLLYTVLAATMFPQVSVLAGMFELVRLLGLYNALPGLSLSYLLFTLPFTTWVLSAFLREVPLEIEQAAYVDGAGPWRTMWQVLLPQVMPAALTAGLLAFIAAWNEFLFALTLTLTDAARTAPVAIALISGASQHELPWGQIMAASVVVTVPVLLLVVFFQRRLLAGLAAGGVKG